MNFRAKHRQAETQEEIYLKTQPPDLAGSCSINTSPNNLVAFERAKCKSSVTASSKLYQSQALEIAEELEQAIEANSIERINKLLDKVLEISEGI